MQYRVTYVHPTDGIIHEVLCSDSDLHCVAGDLYYIHCEVFDRCHILSVTESSGAAVVCPPNLDYGALEPAPQQNKARDKKGSEFDLFRKLLDSYLDKP